MRDRAARAFVVAGSVVLMASALLHIFAGFKVGFPALNASDLAPALKEAFRVVFLSLGWHWIVVAIIALLAAIAETKLRKVYVLLCGFAVLIEAVVGAGMMGLFIGNEMIGAAALLLICGGLLFD